jgi:hypothetical protein
MFNGEGFVSASLNETTLKYSGQSPNSCHSSVAAVDLRV